MKKAQHKSQDYQSGDSQQKQSGARISSADKQGGQTKEVKCKGTDVVLNLAEQVGASQTASPCPQEKLTIKQQFENIWKVKSLGKNMHKKDYQKCFMFFLDGYGCAVIDYEDGIAEGRKQVLEEVKKIIDENELINNRARHEGDLHTGLIRIKKLKAELSKLENHSSQEQMELCENCGKSKNEHLSGWGKVNEYCSFKPRLRYKGIFIPNPAFIEPANSPRGKVGK